MPWKQNHRLFVASLLSLADNGRNLPLRAANELWRSSGVLEQVQEENRAPIYGSPGAVPAQQSPVLLLRSVEDRTAEPGLPPAASTPVGGRAGINRTNLDTRILLSAKKQAAHFIPVESSRAQMRLLYSRLERW